MAGAARLMLDLGGRVTAHDIARNTLKSILKDRDPLCTRAFRSTLTHQGERRSRQYFGQSKRRFTAAQRMVALSGDGNGVAPRSVPRNWESSRSRRRNVVRA